jgi:alkanesulfonate monooxygenase SsuD/methylene tetrahydromethanopterin reductase-like flavin-dependent oxidoreductase (luciferase family)
MPEESLVAQSVVLMYHIATGTKAIRVGSEDHAPNHAPLVVAEHLGL